MNHLSPSCHTPSWQNIDTRPMEPVLGETLRKLEEAGRLPRLDWFLNFCEDRELNCAQATFVLRYLNALINREGHPWALTASYNDLIRHVNEAATIAKDANHSHILIQLSDVLAYYPLQINGLTNFILDFEQLLEHKIGLPNEILEQPQRLAIAQAIVQANFFNSPPINREELEEIRSMNLARLSHDDLTTVTLPKFWRTHIDCADLFYNILRRDSRPVIAAQQPALSQLSKQVSQTLFGAAFNGKTDVVKALLRIPTTNVNGQLDDQQFTALYVACQAGKSEVIKLLQQDPRTDMNLPISSGATSFLHACRVGHIASIKILLENPCVDVNRAEELGGTPFFIACQNGQVSVVQLLLKDPRIDINQPSNDGITPFYMVCDKLMRHLKGLSPGKPLTIDERVRYSAILQDLFNDKRTDIDNCNGSRITPLFHACTLGDLHMVDKLIHDPRVDINRSVIDGATPLFIASQAGYVEIVKKLLSDKRVDPSKALTKGSNALTVASANGCTEIVRLLLEDGRIDVNLTHRDSTTALDYACVYQNLAVVNLLLRDPRIDVNVKDMSGVSPFYRACQKGLVSVVQRLLQDSRVDINLQSNGGATSFFNVCSLLMRGQRTPEPGKTPIKLTKDEMYGLSVIMNDLLKDRRTDIDRPTHLGVSVFYLACEFGNLQLVERLIRDPRGIDINREQINGITPLFVASQHGYVAIVKRLLKEPHITPFKTITTGSNPLTVACRAGHVEVVNLLLRDGRIDVNHARQDGTTALSDACFYQHLEIVRLLLQDPRIDVNKRMGNGDTPFDVACSKDNHQIMQLLLKHPKLDFSLIKQDIALDRLLQSPNYSTETIELFTEHFQLPPKFLEQLGQPLANDANTKEGMLNLYIELRIAKLNDELYVPRPPSSDFVVELVYDDNGDPHPAKSLRHIFLMAAHPEGKLQPEQWTTKKGYSDYHPRCDLVPGGLRIRFSGKSQRAGLVVDLVKRLKDHGIVSPMQSLNRIYIVDGSTYTHELVIFSEKLPALCTLFNLDAEIKIEGRCTTLCKELFLDEEAAAILDTQMQHRLIATEAGTYSLDSSNSIASTLFASAPESRAQLAEFHAGQDAQLSAFVRNDPLALARARACRQPESSMPFPWVVFDLFGMWIRLPEEICQNRSHGIHMILTKVFGLNSLPAMQIHPTLNNLYTKQYLVPRNDIPRFLNALGLGNLTPTINGQKLYVNYKDDLVLVEEGFIPLYHDYEPIFTDNPYTTINESLQVVVFHFSDILPETSLQGRNKSLNIELKGIKTEDDRFFADHLTSYLGYPFSYSNNRTVCTIKVPAHQLELFLRDKLRLDDPDGELSIRDRLWAAHPLTTFCPIIRHKKGKEKHCIDVAATLASSLATLVPEIANKICGLDPNASLPQDIALPTVKMHPTHTGITIPDSLMVPSSKGPQPMSEYLSQLLKLDSVEKCLILGPDKMHELLETHLGMVKLPLRYQNESRKRFHHLYFDANPGLINEKGIAITQPSVELPKKLPKYTEKEMVDILREVLGDHPRADFWLGIFLLNYQIGEDAESQARQQIKGWLSAILNKFADVTIPRHKKTSLINEIGETCVEGLCDNGRASKFYLEYQHLVLPKVFDEVFSTLLSAIATFKENQIIKIISEDSNIPANMNMHAFNAFYKKFHKECGLDPHASRVDASTDKYGSPYIKLEHRDKFFKKYRQKETRLQLIQWVVDSVNATRKHHPSKPSWTQSAILDEAMRDKFKDLFNGMDQFELGEWIYSSLISSKRQRITGLVGEEVVEIVLEASLKGDRTMLEQALKSKNLRPESIPELVQELMPQVDNEGNDDLDAYVLTKEGACELLMALGVLNY